jgi:outer membrane protein
MTKLRSLAMALALAPCAAFASQNTGDFAVTLGYGQSNGGGSPFEQLAGGGIFLETDNDSGVLSGSFTWYVNDTWALELWAADSTTHRTEIDVEPGHDIPLAEFTSRPVALTAQYHFPQIAQRVTPFVGAGWHWTSVGSLRFNPSEFDVAGSKVTNDSGLAVVAGVDIALAAGWFARADLRWMDWSTKASSPGLPTLSANMDTTYYGASIGYRF